MRSAQLTPLQASDRVYLTGSHISLCRYAPWSMGGKHPILKLNCPYTYHGKGGKMDDYKFGKRTQFIIGAKECEGAGREDGLLLEEKQWPASRDLGRGEHLPALLAGTTHVVRSPPRGANNLRRPEPLQGQALLILVGVGTLSWYLFFHNLRVLILSKIILHFT